MASESLTKSFRYCASLTFASHALHVEHARSHLLNLHLRVWKPLHGLCLLACCEVSMASSKRVRLAAGSSRSSS